MRNRRWRVASDHGHSTWRGTTWNRSQRDWCLDVPCPQS